MNTKTYTLEEFNGHPLLARLLELHDIPKNIHIQGELPTFTIDVYGRATPRILTVVGSRKHSTYGKQALEKLIASLAGYDVIILSGLALGVDGISHKTALTHNLTTIAVPGSGLDKKVLYPRAHVSLAEDIIQHGGALLSEFASTTPPALWTFPQRNRIMAALSDAVLFIEAEEKSGTLITARQALELGRDIGAVPGDIFSPTSHGTNMLIREGAYPITCQDDLLALLHLSKLEFDTIEKYDEKKYTVHEKIILDTLREPLDKDSLFTRTKLSFEEFIVAFSSLEIAGAVEETFGEVRRLV